MKRIFSLVLMVSSILFAVSASAAKIEPYTDEVMGCTWLLSGEIVKGDAGLLSALIATDAKNFGRLCLNSHGGSFAEAVKLVEVIKSSDDFGTAIAKGHVCESACAIVFMAGGFYSYDFYSYEWIANVSPLMHPQSTLGFHAPDIPISEGSFTADEIRKSWSLALLSVAQLAQLRTKGYVFPEALFLQWLKTPPESMFFIDTVGRASSAGIYVYPVGINSNSIKESLINICVSNDVSGGYEVFTDPPKILKSSSSQIIASFSEGFQDERTDPCTVNLNIDASSSTHAVQHPRSRPIAFSFNSEAQIDKLDDYVDYEAGAFPYMSYDPDSLLSELPDDIDASWSKFLEKISTNTLDKDQQANRQCFLGSDTSTIINVEDYVNLRESPDFGAVVLGKISLNETVFIRSGGGVRTMGSEASFKECVSACKEFANNSESSSARDRASKCINDNAIWYEITDERGNRGWVSRKYLSDEELSLEPQQLSLTPPHPEFNPFPPLQ